MPPLSFTFTHGAISLQGLALGQGIGVLIAFHGFGQGPKDMLSLAEQFAATHRVFLLELPFHGESFAGSSGQTLPNADWKEWFKAFFEANSISRYSLAGYSLGGRLAIFCALEFGERLEHLYLIAADGLVDPIWYKLATGNAVGRFVLKRLMHNPAPLLWATHWLGKLGLLNVSLQRFINKPLVKPLVRWQVYGSWLALSRLYSSGAPLASALQTAPYPVTVFYGQFDRVIPPKSYQVFWRKVPRAQVIILSTGHNQLLNEVTI